MMNGIRPTGSATPVGHLDTIEGPRYASSPIQRTSFPSTLCTTPTPLVNETVVQSEKSEKTRPCYLTKPIHSTVYIP